MLVYACLLVLHKIFWTMKNSFILTFMKYKPEKYFVCKHLRKDGRVLTLIGTMSYYRNITLFKSLNGFLACISIAFCTQDVPMHMINIIICELFINMGISALVLFRSLPTHVILPSAISTHTHLL